MKSRIISNKGFTLLEVILAVTILSTLTVLSTQTISRALKARTKIQAEVDDVSALRDSMRMIKTDINMAYHHRDFEKEILDLAAKSTGPVKAGQPSPTQSQPTPRQTKRFDPATEFVGIDNEVNFVTMNGARTVSNVVQADFIEVGYSLKGCNNLTSKKASQCLYRRTQSLLDDDIKTGGNEIVMLEGVSEFKLRYIGETKQDWVNQWNSTPNSSDAGTKGLFPDAVEVSLTIDREFEKKPRSYSMQFVIPVHFPNNSEKAPASTNTNGGTQGQGSTPSGGGGGN
ncbi:MAG: type II secretion system protein GspJ [Pseudobdellovibrio sp.]